MVMLLLAVVCCHAQSATQIFDRTVAAYKLSLIHISGGGAVRKEKGASEKNAHYGRLRHCRASGERT